MSARPPRLLLVRVISVVNQKGGVGKTTTSVNLGAALARRGRRVLLVDMDPQGNLTDHLLGDPGDGGERTSIYDVIVEGKALAAAIVSTTTDGLFVVPSHPDLAGAELDLASVIGREVILRDALEALEAEASPPFDFVFLDCPPSLGLLSLNALAASRQVFIALQTEFFAMRGLGALDKTVDLVRRRINPTLELGGIIPTLVDATRLAREVLDEVRGHYGDKVFATKIRTNIRLAEAPSHGKHIFDYAPDSPGAADYAQLAKELEEGRASVEGPEIAPPTAMVATPTPVSTVAPLRGIAKAIAEAAAAVGAGAPAGTRAPYGAPPVAAPFTPAAARASSASPDSPRPPPSRPSAVPLPVLRPGPRVLPLSPMPTRPLSALPRPATTLPRAAVPPPVGTGVGTGTGGRRS